MNQARRGRPGRRVLRRRQRGAAAVEFALVSMVLFPLLFGMIEYGLWFNDSLNVRQGVREAARAGIVEDFAYAGCTSSNDMAKLACKATKEIGAVTGPTYVKISAASWTKGTPLVVCAMVKVKTAGIIPLPNHGMVTSRTEMAIENTATTPNSLSYSDTAPAGTSWSWC